MPQRQPGEVVVVALRGPTKFLLCLETTKPKPHYLKFLSETFEPGDRLLDAVVRALEQEAGMKNVRFRLGGDGHIAEICDPRVLSLSPLRSSMSIPSATQGEMHVRHSMVVETTDAVIDGLSNKVHKTPGENETIYTHSVRFDAVNRAKLLPAHWPLFELALAHQAAA